METQDFVWLFKIEPPSPSGKPPHQASSKLWRGQGQGQGRPTELWPPVPKPGVELEAVATRSWNHAVVTLAREQQLHAGSGSGGKRRPFVGTVPQHAAGRCDCAAGKPGS